MVENGWGHSGHSTLKLAVSQKEIAGINWFLVCWYKFRKAKNYFNNFWKFMVKIAHDLLNHGKGFRSW